MLKIKVPDMSCVWCASSVEEAVKRVDPKARIDVDLSSKVVTVETTATDQQIADAVQAAGFKLAALNRAEDAASGPRRP